MVFEACRGVVKQDSQIALYMLPYITIQVLQDSGPEDHKLVGPLFSVFLMLIDPYLLAITCNILNAYICADAL